MLLDAARRETELNEETCPTKTGPRVLAAGKSFRYPSVLRSYAFLIEKEKDVKSLKDKDTQCKTNTSAAYKSIKAIRI